MEINVKRGIRIKMSDGIDLVGDIYFPKTDLKIPAILFRTPYGRDSDNYRKDSELFASNGFAFLNFDVRGRGDSDGVFRPYFNEGKDGYEMIDWISKQSWSNGMVGTYGASYSARIQWLTSKLKPKNLSAMISIVSPSDPFVESPTGVNDPMHLSWRYLVSGRSLKNVNYIDWDKIYRILPLKDMPDGLGMEIMDWNEDVKHQTLDDFWDPIRYQDRFNLVDVPVLHISGWYDDEQIGTFINYIGMRNSSSSDNSRNNQMMIIGPWGHIINNPIKSDKVFFGQEQIIDLDKIKIDWFKRYLYGENINLDSRVRVFIMEKNNWLNLSDWPPSNSKPNKLYLSSSGRANSLYGDGNLVSEKGDIFEGEDKYSYNPLYPVPFITDMTSSQIGGPDNYSPIERRDDVLVYSSKPLHDDLTLLGQVYADLFVKTDAKDTDFMCMLLDVWPDGFAQRLCDGMVRGRYRNGMDHTEFFKKNKVYEVKINMWNTGHMFLKDHMIRLQISSSAFPKYSRNLNTGNDLAYDSQPVTALNEILHSSEFPSNLSFYEYQ